MVDRDALSQLKADRSRLIEALNEAGASITGDKVRCPFHDDTIPSGGVHRLESGTWAFTCHGCTWNGDKRSGDIIDVARRAFGLDFRGACERLGLRNGGNARSNGRTIAGKAPVASRTASDAPEGTTDTRKAVDDAHARLLADSAALDHLWRTRGIDAATATRFGLGITGQPGRRFWTMPIRDAGGTIVAMKAHRADGQDQKSFWTPKGIDRMQLYPLNLEPEGPVWICPGELKALAVAGVGRAAIGITSGEGNATKPNGLPIRALELLRGREAPIVADDDDTGRAWAEHVRRQLTGAGIEARIVSLDLSKAAGLKDVGDWITRSLIEDAREPEAVAATLDHRWSLADPWHGTSIADLWASPRTWERVTYIPTGLTELDRSLGGGFRTRGVHLLAGKTGAAKSQLAVAIALGAAMKQHPVAVFSLELDSTDMAQLVAASLSDVPRGALARGMVSGAYREQLKAATDEHAGIPLTILDDDRWPDGLTRDRFGELLAEGVGRFGWRLVVLDYLSLLVPSDDEHDQYMTDLRHSTALKQLARKHDLALVAVVAVRKGANKKESEYVTIDDVMGAARLAYDAQTVGAVSRDFGDANSGLVHYTPFKNRFARLGGTVQLRWHPKTGRIRDLPVGSNDDSQETA